MCVGLCVIYMGEAARENSVETKTDCDKNIISRGTNRMIWDFPLSSLVIIYWNRFSPELTRSVICVCYCVFVCV